MGGLSTGPIPDPWRLWRLFVRCHMFVLQILIINCRICSRRKWHCSESIASNSPSSSIINFDPSLSLIMGSVCVRVLCIRLPRNRRVEAQTFGRTFSTERICHCCYSFATSANESEIGPIWIWHWSRNATYWWQQFGNQRPEPLSRNCPLNNEKAPVIKKITLSQLTIQRSVSRNV